MDKKLLSAPAVREALGGISDMSLWRWLSNPELGFPRPIYIANRRYFYADEIEAWLERQADEQRQAERTAEAEAGEAAA